MPKSHSDYPINLTFRISVAQRDYLNDVASMHDVTPSDYLRALLDAALAAEAKATLGVAGADDDTAMARAREVVGASTEGGSDD
ncbi:hypothetical protein [Nocardioides deserti]|uniref:CopG family transcriptional regulator n=1 Tax=Nocardioides deserti TaxID=1588644 RepID=A0ABR6UA55_9ACTN|nr:hypothetical protein [Nocardioides deserti]MBC2961321.1 hypothetical protein [Nocardioides deserti]GGO72399.1 hypothetical protein GCM10012276_15670 [Nocardioides deserti]